jgi:hypothetical protein
MVMRVHRSIVVIDIYNRRNLMASSSGSLSPIQFRDVTEMVVTNRKGDDHGIFPNSEISPACLPSKKSNIDYKLFKLRAKLDECTHI